MVSPMLSPRYAYFLAYVSLFLRKSCIREKNIARYEENRYNRK